MNHVPGARLVTHKGMLSTLDHKAIPKSFNIPENSGQLLKLVRHKEIDNEDQDRDQL